MIVADAVPIIGFSRIERLELLRQVVGELVIPDAVYEELVVKGRVGQERKRWSVPDGFAGVVGSMRRLNVEG